jgi:hypothetical protein
MKNLKGLDTKDIRSRKRNWKVSIFDDTKESIIATREFNAKDNSTIMTFFDQEAIK